MSAKLVGSRAESEAMGISATDSFLRDGGEPITARRLNAAAREYALVLSVAEVFLAPNLEPRGPCRSDT